MNRKSMLHLIAALAVGSGTTFATSTVVAHYKMGELEVAGGAAVSGTPAALLASTGTDMTALTDTPTIGAGGAPTACGGSTHFMNFDGVLERYQITPTIPGMEASNGWMMEAWVRPQAGGLGLGFIMSNGHGGAGQALNFDAEANRYGWFVGGVGQINGSVGASGIGTSWDHLALVRNAGTTTLYVNGVVAGSSPSLGTFGFANGCAIGSQYTGGGDHGFTGDIDEVYYSTLSDTFDPATDLHMTNPTDPIIVVPATPTSAGTVTISTATTFTVPIRNAGAANTLTVSAATGLVGDVLKFSLVTPLPLNILPGETGDLEFQYAPGATAASHSATFTVANNSGTPNAAITLTGTAITDPNIEVASTLNFGIVASTVGASKDLEVTNSGATRNLPISSAIVTGGDSAYFTITSSPASIDWDSLDVITVKYDPQGNLGSHSATLELTHNDPDLASPIQVTLTGTSIPRFSVIARYRLGEDDTDLATTTDSAGDYDLTNINATPGTSYNAGSGVTGTTKGIDATLNDVYSRAGTPAELNGRTQNWGMQTWVRPALATGSGQIGAGYGGLYMGVGNGSRGGFSVFSLDGANWGLNIGGITLATSVVPIQGDTWTHVAAVAMDNQIRLYVNGILAHTYGGLGYAPNDAFQSNIQAIELAGQTANSFRSAGGFDEASIFSFVSGQFNPATDLNVSPLADSDGDALLDVWEDKYFGNNDGTLTWAELAATNGSGDADTDTYNDKQEHDADTDPQDDNSFPATGPLAITSIIRTGNTATIQFNGVDGKTYVLKKSLTLADGFPTEVDTITLTGTSSGALEDTNATEAKAFYRVERP